MDSFVKHQGITYGATTFYDKSYIVGPTITIFPDAYEYETVLINAKSIRYNHFRKI